MNDFFMQAVVLAGEKDRHGTLPSSNNTSLKRLTFVGLIALTVAFAPVTHAQYTANFQTNIISGVTSNWAGNYLVGSNTFADVLLIQNRGVLSNGTGYLGYEVSSSNNSVIVDGSGSVWSNTGDLYVGQAGANNSLVIQFTVRVFNRDAYIGFGSTSSNNSVRVLGDPSGIAATRWRAGLLHVGEQGSGNSLIISGSTVYATNLVVGVTPARCDNFVQLDSGGLMVTNATGDAVLEVRRGKLILNGGTLQVDRFVMTNSCAQFIRTGGTLIYGNAVLDAGLDADADGMANGWEQAYGFDPLNGADASADNDGDGFTNLQEFQAGTEPTNASSAFRVLSLESTNDDVLVTWTAGGGRTNVVESAPDLTPLGAGQAGSYSNVSPNIILPGSGDVTTNYLDTGAATNSTARFYRIRLVP